MKAEREKINAKVKADTVRLNGSKLELTADEEMCTFLLVSEGSCTLQMGETDLLLNPGSALLLGAGNAVLSAAGAAVPELVGCRFPLSALHELRSATQRDFARLFLPGEVTVLYGPAGDDAFCHAGAGLPRRAVPAADPALCRAGVSCREQRCGAPQQRDH